MRGVKYPLLLFIMLNYSGKIDIVFPEKGKIYDIIESSGNIRKNLVFQGWSNGVSKPAKTHEFLFMCVLLFLKTKSNCDLRKSNSKWGNLNTVVTSLSML